MLVLILGSVKCSLGFSFVFPTRDAWDVCGLCDVTDDAYHATQPLALHIGHAEIRIVNLLTSHSS